MRPRGVPPRVGVAVLVAVTSVGLSIVPAGAATTSSTSVPRARDVVVAAYDSLGDDAPLGVVLAFDGGYSLTQIVTALAAETLTTDGAVVVGTVTTPPANPATKLVTRAPSTTGAGPGRSVPVVGADPPASLDALLTALAAIEKRTTKAKGKPPVGLRRFTSKEQIPHANLWMLIAIIASIRDGYSAEQVIVEGLLDERIRTDGELGAIVGDDGKFVQPVGRPDTTSIGTTFVDDLLALGAGKRSALSGTSSASSGGATSSSGASAKGAGKPVGSHFAFAIDATITMTGKDTTGTAAVTGSGEMRGGARVLGDGTGEATGSGTCYDGAYNVKADLRFEVSADRSGSTLTILVESFVPAKSTGGSGNCARQAAENMIAALTVDYPPVTVAATRGASATATGMAGGGVVTQSITVILSAA